MKMWAILLFSLVFAGCASTPVVAPDETLFSDQLFSAPSERVSADDVFAVSPEMRHYLHTEIAPHLHREGPLQGLFDALYSKRQLKLEYDSAMTRNAAQAFAARSGNCLSLVIMTAAFANEMGLPVQFQSVLGEEAWSRSGDIYFSLAHVNIVLGKKRMDWHDGYDAQQSMTIDFLPPEEILGQRVRAIDEKTIVAMYMNNRAAEALAAGRVDDAYWWARQAIERDPQYLSSYNTLGVIYRRHGNLPQAEQTLVRALEHDPRSTLVMSNLVAVLNDLGRVADAKLLSARLEQLEPTPPFHFFNLGMTAMRARGYAKAKILFEKEIARDPYYHEFHFWLGIAHLRLGEVAQAGAEMHLALDASTTRDDRALYAAKLDRINAYRQQ
ncbi:MAG TPA: hypothetical protein DIT28_00895 [Oxalobacteraceae bacterium]|nr:hypothetical protein [Oxalobacteraceae bacterium]